MESCKVSTTFYFCCVVICFADKLDFVKRYDGPQPPSGQNHLYIFTLYALDQKISFASRQVTKNDLTQAMTGHILAETNWTGRFGS
jgi:phosphatidylethanolamine-binding protein (PEBP) family uncharacterized protein